MSENLISGFKKYIAEEKLFSPGNKILLAVSGGIDSVVMAHLFKAAGYGTGIAHCNFQLRGKDSEEDEKFVKDLAAEFKLGFYSTSFETKKYQQENKLSPEEAARILRYAWFEEIRQLFNYDFIATAHHLNDAIETIFLNLTKGTGIKGLTGIPSKNGKIIRPLLFTTREEIATYALENKIRYRNDTTNFENDFARNKIRNQVIPVLKTINPSLEQTFKKNIVHFNDAELIYREQIKRKLKKLVTTDGNNKCISIPALMQLPAAATYLFELLHPKGFNSEQVEGILNNLTKPGKVFYSASHRVITDRKNIILCAIEHETGSVILIEKENKTVRFGNYKLDFQVNTIKKEIKFNSGGSIVYFDADKIVYPLTLRKWKKGDYFYPLGLAKKNSDKPGKKKISDLFNDLKFNLLQKENTWVLLSGEKIIWVVGIRQDERMKLSKIPSHMLKIKMLP